MMRFKSTVITLILLYLIVAALHFVIGVSSLYALLLAPLIILRGVYWRVGLNRLLSIILLAGVPILLRRRSRAYLQHLSHRFRLWIARRWARSARLWAHLPMWIQAVLGVVVVGVAMLLAILSGVVLWLIAFLPFIAKTAVGLFIIRYLAHLAAAQGVKRIVPLLWRIVPRPIRDWSERRYKHLWWWTMRRIVRNRKRVVRRFRRRLSEPDIAE